MRVVVVGAGVGGLACAMRLAHRGHAVTVLEATGSVGGKAGRVELDAGDGRRVAVDSGPSLLTMPHVFRALFAETGGPLPVELLPVRPVTRYRFADGTTVDLDADLDRSCAALEAWSPGAGDDWRRLLRISTAMWRSAEPLLGGPPPWPPRRPGPDAPPPDPRALLAVRPWHTLASLAAAVVRDPRLRMVVERFATYAGADPRRAPAALALAGYPEHRWGAWHPRGGIAALVAAMRQRAEALGVAVRPGVRATGIRRAGGRADAVRTTAGVLAADAVVWNGDALALRRALRGDGGRMAERSLSGLAILLALRAQDDTDGVGAVHHEIRFPAVYGPEFDDIFVARRPARDGAVYVATSSVTCAEEAPAGVLNSFVLVNAPAGVDADWEAEADRVLARLGVAGRVLARRVRSPADLERETGAVGGAIYGRAPHGRLGTLRRPGPRVGGLRNVLRVGGTVHPGGGLPLVALGAANVAREIGPA